MTKAGKSAKPKQPKPIKLDLGCGKTYMDGYTPVDIQMDGAVDVFETLQYPDGLVSEIRASHILEHCSWRRVPTVLADWVRVLKPGGWMKIAVPNFDTIARDYVKGIERPYDAYLVGGHTFPNDCHGSIYTNSRLRKLMRNAGLIDITEWPSDNDDCSSLDISLNLKGRKMPSAVAIAVTKPIKVGCVISVPRLGFNDHWGCMFKALGKLGIKIHKTSGAYWEQHLERGLIAALENDEDLILTTDYDTIFSQADVEQLIYLMRTHAKIDAVSSVQFGRSIQAPLFTAKKPNGKPRGEISSADLSDDLFQVPTAHFGLTMLRATSLKDFPHPWLHARPNDEGRWEEGKVDADISFWQKWEATGRTLFLAPRVSVGHLEVMIKWAGPDMKVVLQDVRDYLEHDKPRGVWK